MATRQPVIPTRAFPHFVTLGFSPASEDDFSPLQISEPLSDVLQFLHDHLLGRANVLRARMAIQLQRQHTSPSAKQDTIFTDYKRAKNAEASARTAVQLQRNELNERLDNLGDLQDRIDAAQKELDARKRAKEMLVVLEEREVVRIERLRTLTRMLDALGKSADCTTILPKMAAQHPVMPKQQRLKCSHTRDALAHLRAHHIRMAKLLKSSTDISTAQTIDHLRLVVQRDAKNPAHQVDVIVDRCLAAARRKAHKRVCLGAKPIKAMLNPKLLDERLQTIHTKEKRLQRLSNMAIAVAARCCQIQDSVAIFQRTTSPLLAQSLVEETPRAKGFVGVLRRHLDTSVTENDLVIGRAVVKMGEKTGAFPRQVEELLGVRKALSSERLVLEVEAIVENVRRRRAFLAVCQVPPPPDPAKSGLLLARHHEEIQVFTERAMKLLTRKVDKANLGRNLITEIEQILNECKLMNAGL